MSDTDPAKAAPPPDANDKNTIDADAETPAATRPIDTNPEMEALDVSGLGLSLADDLDDLDHLGDTAVGMPALDISDLEAEGHFEDTPDDTLDGELDGGDTDPGAATRDHSTANPDQALAAHPDEAAGDDDAGEGDAAAGDDPDEG